MSEEAIDIMIGGGSQEGEIQLGGNDTSEVELFLGVQSQDQGDSTGEGENVPEDASQADLAMIQAELNRAKSEAASLSNIVDKLLEAQGQGQKGGGESDYDPEKFMEEFEEDPKKALESLLESQKSKSKDDNKEAEERLAQLEAKIELQRLAPDFEKVVNDEGFVKWVESDPIIYAALEKANFEYDTKTFAAIVNKYKEQGDSGVSRKVDPSVRSRGKASKSSGKIFSRKAIGELMVKSPQKYAEMEAEIMQAFREGRVK